MRLTSMTLRYPSSLSPSFHLSPFFQMLLPFSSSSSIPTIEQRFSKDQNMEHFVHVYLIKHGQHLSQSKDQINIHTCTCTYTQYWKCFMCVTNSVYGIQKLPYFSKMGDLFSPSLPPPSLPLPPLLPSFLPPSLPPLPLSLSLLVLQ